MLGMAVTIFTIPPIIADKFNIPLVFYAEDGEWNMEVKRRL